jgi:hypothetical protein
VAFHGTSGGHVLEERWAVRGLCYFDHAGAARTMTEVGQRGAMRGTYHFGRSEQVCLFYDDQVF